MRPSRFRQSDAAMACPAPAPAPIATCGDRAALGAGASPGREYAGSLDFGRPVEYLIASGRVELMIQDGDVVGPWRFKPKQTEPGAPADPFLVNTVAEVPVPSGYQGARCRITASCSYPLVGEDVRFALYSGTTRLAGPWTAHVNGPHEVPLGQRQAAGAREFRLCAALSRRAASQLPVRSQIAVYATIELWALGDTPLGLDCAPCPCPEDFGGRR